MNGYTRYIRLLRGQSVDVVPRVPILMQYAAEFIGANYGAFASDHKVLVEANVACAEAFGFDQVSAISDPYRETSGFGADIEFVPNGVPRCLSVPLSDTKDLDALADPDPHRSERMLDRIRAVEAFRDQVGGRYSILGWVEGPAAEAADLRGVSEFLIDMMTDEDFANRLMMRCTDVGIAFAAAQVEAGADTVGIGDAIASQCSLDMYERLILPHERRLVDAVRDMHAFVRLHICGDITHLLPAIAALDIDILDLDHMVCMKGARKAIPRRVTLAGNIDPVEVLRCRDPDLIASRMRDIADDVGPRYMVAAGCEIPSGTPPGNLRALCAPITPRT